MIRLDVEAKTVGAGLMAKGLAFDPTSIITIAFALWQQCLKIRGETQNPAEYLKAQFDGEKFSQDLLNDARHNARRANRIAFRSGQSEKRHLSDAELDQISTEALRHVMEADDDVLKACCAEAADMTVADFEDDDGGAE